MDIASRALELMLQAPPAGQAAPRTFRKEKLVAETALLLYAASDVPEPTVQLRIARVAAQLLPFARNEALLTMIRARPLLALECSLAHGVLTHLGWKDAAYQGELAAILEMSPRVEAERTPWKDFEAAWIETRCGLALPSRHATGAVERTTLGMGLDALYCGRQALYHLTHALIYTTDFGNARVEVARGLQDVVEEIEFALAACIDEDDFDLSAELLLAWPYLRVPWTATSRLGMRVLSRTEDAVGFLPSLSVREEDTKGLDAQQAARHIMTEAYHTAYVMGILVAALLAHAPPDAPPDDAQPSLELADALRALLPPRAKRPQWEVEFGRLSAQEQAGCARFLVHVGIRRALGDADFNRVSRILVCAVGDGMVPDAAMGQASLLLQRLARSRLAGCGESLIDAAPPLVA